MVINIVICDDEKLFAQDLSDKIRNYSNWENNTYKILIFTSSEQLENKVKDGLKIDIIFMDVQLKDKFLGTNIGIHLKTHNPNILIVYVTFYDLYYEELVKAEPFDFIHKPISQDNISKVLDKAIIRLHYIKREFIYRYKYNGIFHNINLKDVLYFESQHRVVNIHCVDGLTHQFYEKLDNVEKEIEEIYPCFLRANKSYYINFNYISEFSNSSVSINGIEIKLGRQYKERFSKKYNWIVLTWYAR